MKKTKYVDGYVLIVAKKNFEAYKKMATDGRESWLRHGALNYKECVGEDLHPDIGEFKMLDFTTLTKAGEDDLVIFSYIEFESRADRDRINKLVQDEMQQMDMSSMEMPFEMERMSVGGFEVFVGE